MIGMSLYPYWCINWDNKDADGNQYTDPKVITDCIANIKAVSARYGCDVMVVETGMECADDKGNLASDAVLQQGRSSWHASSRNAARIPMASARACSIGSRVQAKPIPPGCFHRGRKTYRNYERL